MGLRNRMLWSISILALISLFLSACAPDRNKSITGSLDLHTSLFTITTKATPQNQTAETPLAENQQDTGEQFLVIEELVILMLFVAVLVGITTHRLRIPYTIGLVLVGLLMTLRGAVEITVSPTLILGLLVPPLIFEAAFHMNLRDLRQNLVPITILAIPGVLLTTILVGGIVSLGAGIALPIALVFGSIVSATDPVSVIALFRKLGVPKRLRVLLEGESLFNDGTAIVVFQLVLTIAITGTGSFNLANSVIDFLVIAGGGLAVGLLLGTLVSELIKRIDDYLIETTLTSVLAFGSFLVAEILGVSGVLAVVAAGLVNGNIGPRGMSPTTRIVVFNFWEYAAFLSNTFVFLLIGLQIDLAALFQSWQSILWAIAAILVARAVSIYGLSRIGRAIPLAWQHVLYWGGLRGAISLALALSLPTQLGGANSQIQVMTFGVVLFTLIVQGLSMKPLVRRLGITERRSEQKEEYERRHARAVASRAGYEHLQRRHKLGMISDHSWQRISPVLQERARSQASTVREVLAVDPSVEAEELDTARREYFRAQRSAVSGLLKDGVISDDTYAHLIAEIDTAITTPQSGWSNLLGNFNGQNQGINRLMAAVIQEQDVENAISSLSKMGILFTRLPSSGGFLGRRNTTLLIGLTHEQIAIVVESLKRSCRRRVEYLPALPEGLGGVIAAPISVTVGGATVFTFAVERFETF
jgi:monovalent cation:H+ antiporter, CPA1 family